MKHSITILLILLGIISWENAEWGNGNFASFMFCVALVWFVIHMIILITEDI